MKCMELVMIIVMIIVLRTTARGRWFTPADDNIHYNGTASYSMEIPPLD